MNLVVIIFKDYDARFSNAGRFYLLCCFMFEHLSDDNLCNAETACLLQFMISFFTYIIYFTFILFLRFPLSPVFEKFVDEFELCIVCLFEMQFPVLQFLGVLLI